MKIKQIAVLALLFVCLASISFAGVAPLVVLETEKLSEGPLETWSNAGSLNGIFRSSEKKPQVKVVDGVKAVAFSGSESMTSDITAPQSITGNKPWTCVVRAYSTEVRGERTVFSWASRPMNCLEIEYGDAVLWGAIGTWNDPHTLGWMGKVPQTGKWHTLVYSYSGRANGQMQAWCDGQLCASKTGTLATKTGKPFVVAACMLETEPNKFEYVHHFTGSIASIKIYDRLLSPLEIWNASGYESAYPSEPKRDITVDSLTVTLKWQAGNSQTASYDIYVGTNKAAVEKANNKLSVGKAKDWKKVYKGNQTVSNSQFGPVSLNLDQTYYWRIDQRDSLGKVAQRGEVWKFSTEDGKASNPSPADGYFIVEGGKYRLRWQPGKYASKQDVYIGKSSDEVLAKKKPDLAGLSPDTNSIELPVKNPVPGQTYFWRIDSINRDKLPVSKGKAWSFRAVRKNLKVYLQGGQSNAVGCSSVNGIPEKFKEVNKSVIIFVRGECRLGEYGWSYLKDGLGSGFGDVDGKGTFGPELTFGADMAPKKPDEVIAIIKCAWGGTNLGAQWRPPSAGGETGPLYKGFVAAVHEGLDKLDPAFQPEICGMIWMQGESDSGDQKMAEDYAKNLTCFINDIRAEVEKPDMPFVLAQIKKAPAWDNPPGRGQTIRDAQKEVAKTVPNTATFGTSDYGMCDPWHYDTPGMVSLGKRFAKAMKELRKDKN